MGGKKIITITLFPSMCRLRSMDKLHLTVELSILHNKSRYYHCMAPIIRSYLALFPKKSRSSHKFLPIPHTTQTLFQMFSYSLSYLGFIFQSSLQFTYEVISLDLPCLLPIYTICGLHQARNIMKLSLVITPPRHPGKFASRLDTLPIIFLYI